MADKEELVQEVPVRHSRVRKTIRRIYNIAQYESLEVEVSFDEDIAWSNLEERDNKTKNLTKLLICDLYETSLDTMNLLEVDNYRAKLEKLKLKKFVDDKAAEKAAKKADAQ